MTSTTEPLTELQRVILEIDALGLDLRSSIRQANQRVPFFVGQQRYQEELTKAREKLASAQPS